MHKWLAYPVGYRIPVRDERVTIAWVSRGRDGALYGEFDGHMNSGGHEVIFRIDFNDERTMDDELWRHLRQEAARRGLMR